MATLKEMVPSLEDPLMLYRENSKLGTCFHDVRAGKPDYDYIYCGGNTMIAVLACVNTVIFAYLLFVHLKTSRVLMLSWQAIMLKVKTSILILLIIFEIIVVIRYTAYFSNTVYNVILVASQFL